VAWMVKGSRRLARHALSRAWVSNDCFSFLYGINRAGEVPNPSPCYLNLQLVGTETHFLTADLQARPAPLLVRASGGDHDKRPWDESPGHDGHQPPSHRARIDVSSSRASPLARWGFTRRRLFLGLASCCGVDLSLL
jgi:hypothetical protein